MKSENWYIPLTAETSDKPDLNQYSKKKFDAYSVSVYENEIEAVRIRSLLFKS